ncbi:hypothetical protein UCRPA7_4505 [Phaeoacremonium minimum UCRPA7]|uniref:DUF7918 domain-containing protein n=1 Tax=Phaeoacremonium minimum (strain UCR-PA7) TaxID=1286976 RepID=R8BL29_PHAM7|nr:hypothetical protein UCRPA7_4505 [Phaeoacremonium minimum UCRPA7]EOO00073.1 hypothetical protein UCRPA7_4505 [Phaeoacremonium minimum UCRPA7]
MAVIEDFKLEAGVKINGSTAPEYDDPDGGEGDGEFPIRCNKYIECIDGAEFSISAGLTGEYSWLNQGADHGLVFHLSADGKYVTNKICGRKAVLQNTWSTEFRGHVKHSEHGPSLLCKFKFAPLHKVDDTDKSRVKQDIKRAKHLGLIEVKISRIEVGETLPKLFAQDKQIAEFSIAEKALKGRAVSHGTSYSEAVPTEKSRTVDCVYIDNDPIAIFTFKYRSREALKEEMIIPRSPSPDLQLNGLAADEIARLAKERLAQIKDERSSKRRRSVKSEHDQSYDLTGDAGPSRPLKISKRDGGRDLIDLTDD